MIDEITNEVYNMKKCLYGNQASDKHIIGFCWNHKVALTVKQLKHKECLKKQCNALEKYEHEYWRQRELMKLKRKNKKGIIING